MQTEQERRAEATRAFQVRIARATIQHSKDPARVAEAKAHLARLEGAVR